MSSRSDGGGWRVPRELFDDYLKTSGVGGKLEPAIQRRDQTSLCFEQRCDLCLEIEDLMARTPFPQPLQDRILGSLDRFSASIVVRVGGPEEPKDSRESFELLPARTHAQALEAIRAGWSRTWSLCSDPVLPRAATPPLLDVVETRTLSPAERQCIGRRRQCLPDGRSVEMAPAALAALLDAIEAELLRGPTAAAIRDGLAGTVFVRYAFGACHNCMASPDGAFEFLNLLVPVARRLEEPRRGGPRRQSSAEQPAQRPPADPAPGCEPLLQQARRSVSLEARLVELSAASGSAVQRSAEAPRAQQLVGTAAAPGRAVGMVWRAAAHGADRQRHEAPAASSSGVVLVCGRLAPRLLEEFPALTAVVERHGGRVGLGALLARAHGLPCVSGVPDLDLLPDGAQLYVDGDLGLVTVGLEHARVRRLV